MSSSNYIMVLNNKRIHEYYANNPHLNFETVNLLMLDFLDQVQGDHTKIVTQTQTTEILDLVRTLTHTASTSNNDLLVKVQACNQTFVEHLKLRQASDTTQLVNAFGDKLALLLPQATSDSMQRAFSDFKVQLKQDLEQADNKKDGGDLEATLQKLQLPLFSALSASHEQLGQLQHHQQTLLINHRHLEDGLGKIRDVVVAVNDQQKMANEFIGKYKASSQFKGQASENQLERVLNHLLPEAEVVVTRGIPASGDYMLKRTGKYTILVENKNYERNVTTDEVAKFVRDVTAHKLCGIMLSQFSGIVGKPNFFIEVNDGKVLVYVHQVDYSPEKIQLAVNVIDNLVGKLANIQAAEEDRGIVIEKETLDKINQQFQAFLAQKERLAASFKEYSKGFYSQLDDLKMPDLALYLNDKFASAKKTPKQRKGGSLTTEATVAGSTAAVINVATTVVDTTLASTTGSTPSSASTKTDSTATASASAATPSSAATSPKNIGTYFATQKTTVKKFLKDTYGETFRSISRKAAFESYCKLPHPLLKKSEFHERLNDLKVESYMSKGTTCIRLPAKIKKVRDAAEKQEEMLVDENVAVAAAIGMYCIKVY